MKRLLFIDNQGDNLWPTTVSDLFMQSGFEIEYVHANTGDFPKDFSRFDSLFFSGSVQGVFDPDPWIEQEKSFIRNVIESDVPVLGSCFGSQILASALFGDGYVFKRNFCEAGYLPIHFDLASNDPLLRGLDDQENMFVWHNDEVKVNHENMIILAGSADCPNQIWRYRGKPVWGIQGHPELNKDQVIDVLSNYKQYFLRAGLDVGELARQAGANDHVIRLIRNFIRFSQEYRA